MTAPEIDVLVKFQEEAASYFTCRDTKGEDSAFWANVTNADNCHKTASALTAQAAEIATLRATNRELVRQVAEANAREARLREAAARYCWERYKGRDPLNLTSPAVFTSHEHQKIGEYIDRALSGDPT